MKDQSTGRSKVFINTNRNRFQALSEQIEFENPENNFEKLNNMKPDIPAREFSHLIQTMSEHCSFEKNYITKTANVHIPNYVRSEAKRKQVFEDYELIRAFSHLQKKREHFQTRKFSSVKESSKSILPFGQKLSFNKIESGQQYSFSKSSDKTKIQKIGHAHGPRNLSEILDKLKNNLLLEDNILKMKQEKVSSILKDSQKRDSIFEQSLFLERFYDIQIQKFKQFESSGDNSVPEKFRGVEPRHIRISTQGCKNQQQYIRNKYVYKKRKLQFYSHARKIQSNSFKNKKKQNTDVLETIMKFNEAKCAAEETLSQRYTKGSKNYQRDIYAEDFRIKRLFLKYTCFETENPEEMYMYMTDKELFEFFTDFQLKKQLETNLELKQYIEQKKDQRNKQQNFIEKFQKVKYYIFDFLQILYILAFSYKMNREQTALEEFLRQKIWANEKKVIPDLWKQLNKVKKNLSIQKYLQIVKFKQICTDLFEQKCKKQLLSVQFETKFIDFDDTIEILWKIKLFPVEVSKKQVRFIYLYSVSHEKGLTLTDFIDLMIVTGLKFGTGNKNSDKIKWISKFLTK